MTTTRLHDAEEIDLGITHGPMDGECARCRDPFEIFGVIILWDDSEVCPNCAPPELAQVAKGVSLVHEVLVLGRMSSANRQGVAKSLRLLADLAEKIDRGELVVRKSLDLAAGPWSGFQPVGVHLDWHVELP